MENTMGFKGRHNQGIVLALLLTNLRILKKPFEVSVS